jgi:formylglycine-generating enzyme required for sulfatase activity
MTTSSSGPVGSRPPGAVAVRPSRPAEDLSRDPLVALLPRDPEGRPLAGRIPLLCRIGMGGMGAVYYAVHPRLNVEVAVKILPPHLAEQDPSLVDRFRAEARLAAALASDHVVRVLDVDREAGTSYLVMEYVAGASAGEHLRNARAGGGRGLSEAEAIEIALAAARGLAAAHERGIVHRDIKPENILIPGGERGKAKLADLGLAKPQGDLTRVATSADAVMGTPGFMAPEQIEDPRSAGTAADVFSMGATLYALLAGQAPFTGEGLGAVLRRTSSDAAPDLPGDVSPAVRALVARCLAKDPAERPADGRALVEALVAAREGRLPPGAFPSRRRRWIALAALALGAAAAALAFRGGDSPAPVHGSTLALDLGDGVSLDLVYLAPGAFTMGGTEPPAGDWQADERPPHEVTIPKGFYLGKTEVTRRQFGAFVKATGFRTDAERDTRATGLAPDDRWTTIPGLSWRDPNFSQADEDPVVCITWNDANAFCTWLSRRTGREARLPAEAEWEYACRAGTKTRWSFGDDPSVIGEHAWTVADSGRRTRPVGRKRPNPWGLYDMHGNMWEWCADLAQPYPGSASPPPAGERHVLRGGGWESPPEACRSAYRCRDAEDTRQTLHGFRVAVSAP